MLNLLAPIGANNHPLAGLPLAAFEWFPTDAATNVQYVDPLFWGITWVCIFFFVLITALTVRFVVKYRHRPGHKSEASPHHNNSLEITWSIIPLLIVMVFFYYGFTGFLDSRTPPDDAYVIDVVAQKWSWAFKYENGSVTDTNLHVPLDRPVKLVLSSTDVLHSLYIPAFRVKMDCVPGKYTDLWFRATQASQDDNKDGKLSVVGDKVQGPAPINGFDLFCAEYCGTGHSSMYAKVFVHEAGGFERWMKKAKDPRSQGTPVEVGKKLYSQRGCAQCHSLDGKDRPGNGGPSFKGHFGTMQAFADGSQHKMDENYIRESILNPAAKVRQGYRNIMPTFQGQLNDDQIYALIQFIKSVNDEEIEDWQPKEGEESAEGEAEATPQADEAEGGEAQEGEAEGESAATTDKEAAAPAEEESSKTPNEEEATSEEEPQKPAANSPETNSDDPKSEEPQSDGSDSGEKQAAPASAEEDSKKANSNEDEPQEEATEASPESGGEETKGEQNDSDDT